MFVPRTSSTPVAMWFWQTEGRSAERVILGGPTERVHLVGVSISFEKNFYRLSFTPPLSGCLIGPSLSVPPSACCHRRYPPPEAQARAERPPFHLRLVFSGQPHSNGGAEAPTAGSLCLVSPPADRPLWIVFVFSDWRALQQRRRRPPAPSAPPLLHLEHDRRSCRCARHGTMKQL
jgi:hypothetical protein